MGAPGCLSVRLGERAVCWGVWEAWEAIRQREGEGREAGQDLPTVTGECREGGG